jgi:hypothetical protein
MALAAAGRRADVDKIDQKSNPTYYANGRLPTADFSLIFVL